MKAARLVFAILFIVVCCIPVYTMPLFADDSSAEKRQETEAPSILLENGNINWEYPSLMDSFLSDHFSFRTPAVTLMSIIKAELGTSAQDKIIVGEDDWLFFSETLDDYMGTDLMSDYDISRLATTLELINEYVEGVGGRFVFAAAPNKNSVYGEYMPYYYTESKAQSNLERLNALLGDQGFNVDLLSLMRESKDKGLLYHKRDSHWNNLGASLAYAKICERLGVSVTDYSKIEYSIQKTWRGDLDDMIFPSLSILDDQVIFNKEYTFSYSAKYKSPEDIIISATNNQKQGSLCFFRDSFCNALLPFFAEEFQSSEFLRATPYRITASVEEGGAVVIEIAERNLANLLKSAPIMTAAEKSFEGLTEIEATRIEKGKSGKLAHIYGSLADNIDANRLVISVTQEGVTKYYKPFPIYEQELLEGSGNGFSLYLAEALSEDAQISVYTEN